MDILGLITIAIGLSMDALAVSVTNGFLIKQLKLKHALIIAFSFGLFQALMPILGWFAGLSVKGYIEAYDHWIAFTLLLFIGGKMIIDSFSKSKEEKTNYKLSPLKLLLLSLATSIDALAVGFSFAILHTNIYLAVIIIGLITFILCFIGVFVGNKSGHLFEDKLEFLGGIILIIIGLKILLEHLIKHI